MKRKRRSVLKAIDKLIIAFLTLIGCGLLALGLIVILITLSV